MAIWLDVTTILGWTRPAVGIVRVESECAKFFLQTSDKDIKYCHFDRSKNNYVEIDKEYVIASLKRIKEAGDKRNEAAAPVGVQSDLSSANVPTKQERLKSFIFKIISCLPHFMRGRAFRFLQRRKQFFFEGITAYKSIKAACRAFLKPDPINVVQPDVTFELEAPSVETEKSSIFTSSDVYVSMGLDWDQKGLDLLYRLKRKSGFKVILFCYDIIPVKFPHLCVGDVASKFARYFTDVAWCADEVLCISDCSKRDLESLLTELGSPLPSLKVVRLGSEVAKKKDEPPSGAIAELLAEKFILFVSTIERRKNHETIYRAYTRLIEAGHTNLPLLVFVGMPGWGVNDFLCDLKFDDRIKPYIKILNHLSDSDLAYLYSNTQFTVYPSLYEGWGLPVAESLAYGKFCLASNVASIPEVGGELIEYLDPWDVKGWADRLLWYIAHPEEIKLKESNIISHYKVDSWENTGRFVLDEAVSLAFN